MYFIEIGGQKYATGLWWQTSEANSGRALKKDVTMLSKTFREEQNVFLNCFVAQAKGKKLETSLVGLGNCEQLIDQDGQLSQKVLSLALAVLNASEHRTFLYKYHFDDGVWVLGVLNGVVHPDGDFFGTEEEAQDVFKTLLNDAYSSSEEVSEFDDIESISHLEEMLAGVHDKNFIAPIKNKFSKKQIVTTIIVAGGLIAGAVAYHFVVENRNAKIKKAKMLAAQQMLLQKNQGGGQKEAFPKKWLSEPYASFFSSMCKKAMEDRSIVENGWQISEWNCNPEAVSITWNKLETGFFQVLPEGSSFDIETPRETVTTDRFAQQDFSRSEAPLLGMADASAKIHDIAQTYQLRIDCDYFLEPEKKQIVDKDNPGNSKTLIAPFKKIEFKLTGFAAFPSAQLFQMLDSVSGMVVEELFYNNKWVLKGTVYVTI